MDDMVLFPEIRLVHFKDSKEPFRILREVNDFFQTFNRLWVWQYYDLLMIEDVPPEANNYLWLTNEAFTFGKNAQGYYIKADEPIRIIDTTPTEEVE